MSGLELLAYTVTSDERQVWWQQNRIATILFMASPWIIMALSFSTFWKVYKSRSAAWHHVAVLGIAMATLATADTAITQKPFSLGPVPLPGIGLGVCMAAHATMLAWQYKEEKLDYNRQ